MRTTIIILFLLCNKLNGFCQQIDLSHLLNPKIKVFRNSVYVFAFSSDGNKLQLKSLKLDSNLTISRQSIIELGNSTDFGLPSLNVDTQHCRLNVSFQNLKIKEKSFLVQYNENLDVLHQFNEMPSNRLNAFFAFDTDVLYSGNSVYSVRRISTDSSAQFLVRKFNLIENKGMDEYKENWQFSFKNSSYSLVQLIRVGMGRLFLFAHAKEGNRKGQWLIQMNQNTGKVLQATKITSPNDKTGFYLHSSHFDSSTAQLLLTGSFLEKNRVMLQESDFPNQKSSNFFSIHLICIDTAGTFTENKEFKIPVNAECKNSRKYSSLFMNSVSIQKVNQNYFILSSVLGNVIPGRFDQYGLVFFEYDPTISPSKLSQITFIRTDYSERKDDAYLRNNPSKYFREKENAGMVFKDLLSQNSLITHSYFKEQNYFFKCFIWKDQIDKKSVQLFLNEYNQSALKTKLVQEFNKDGLNRNIVFISENYLILSCSSHKLIDTPVFRLEKIKW